MSILTLVFKLAFYKKWFQEILWWLHILSMRANCEKSKSNENACCYFNVRGQSMFCTNWPTALYLQHFQKVFKGTKLISFTDKGSSSHPWRPQSSEDLSLITECKHHSTDKNGQVELEGVGRCRQWSAVWKGEGVASLIRKIRNTYRSVLTSLLFTARAAPLIVLFTVFWHLFTFCLIY